MRRFISIVCVCFIIGLFTGCEPGQSGPNRGGGSETGQGILPDARDFELYNMDGTKVRLSDYKGKIIILNFFGTWCPPCKVEMPHFEEIAKEYSTDVEVIAVNVDGEPLKELQSFAGRTGITFKVLSINKRVSDLYGPIRSIPVTYIIDKNFKIARKFVGSRPKSVFVNYINELR